MVSETMRWDWCPGCDGRGCEACNGVGCIREDGYVSPYGPLSVPDQSGSNAQVDQ